MLQALNAIVEFFNMIIHVVKQFVYFALLLPQYCWKAYTLCQSILVYIPQPFLAFALVGLTVSIAFAILRIIHG